MAEMSRSADSDIVSVYRSRVNRVRGRAPFRLVIDAHSQVEVFDKVTHREHGRRVLVVKKPGLTGGEAGREANQDREDLIGIESDSLPGREQFSRGSAGDSQQAVGDQLQPLRIAHSPT